MTKLSHKRQIYLMLHHAMLSHWLEGTLLLSFPDQILVLSMICGLVSQVGKQIVRTVQEN